jgi:hypothetical protein
MFEVEATNDRAVETAGPRSERRTTTRLVLPPQGFTSEHLRCTLSAARTAGDIEFETRTSFAPVTAGAPPSSALAGVILTDEHRDRVGESQRQRADTGRPNG